MPTIRTLLPALLLPLLGLVPAQGEDDPATLYQTKVKPLLEARCVECHGPKKAKHNLRVDSREALLVGGKELGPAIVPGKPDESPLVKVLRLPESDDLSMPPKMKGKPLTDEEVGWIKAWIAGGAPVPAAAPSPAK